MNKLSLLRWQFIGSTIVAYLIIIFSFWFFLDKQNSYSSQVDEYMTLSQEKFNEIQQWEIAIQKFSKYKNLQSQQNSIVEDQLKDQISNSLKKLEEKDLLIDKPIAALADAKAMSASFFEEKNQVIQNLNSVPQRLAEEQERIVEVSNKITNEVVQRRKDKVAEGHKNLDKTRRYTVIFGIFSLLVILLVLLQTMRILAHLRKTGRRGRDLNQNLMETTKQLEDVNWVLQNSSKIHNQINGLLSEQDIAKTSVNFIADVVNFYAAAFYVRKIDSYQFTLRYSKGLENKETINQFLMSDGILGAVAEEKKPKILPVQDLNRTHIQTGTIKNLEADVIIFPIINEDYCIGVLEIIGSFPEDKKESILNYLDRTTQSIGSTLHSRQNHALVEELLTETQRQTEELEAQQEELRITNEELVYKTNLLEASEEELRVQQEELSQANKELNEKAAELERRNLELNEAHNIVEQKIVEVEQASKYKSEFMANMSHELRTPLNSILILAKLLQDNKQKNLNEEQTKYASVIHNAGSDLLQLINELLDLAKIESGKVEMMKEQIQTRAFALNIESLFKELAKEKSIQFDIDISQAPEHFVTDEYRLEQVLKNFLSNAFKFTEKKGKIDLTISQQSGNLQFSVRDSGIGISEDKQALIFEAFRQEDGSTSRKYGGTGLGLSISREISSLLNGRISLQSALGEGSTFTLIIPYLAEVPTTEEQEVQKETKIEREISNLSKKEAKPAIKAEPIFSEKTEIKEKAEGKSILIIEDDVNFADILKGFSTGFGFHTMNAYDGIAGIQMARQKQPDAIILDVMLPLADGWQVLKTLKNDPATKHIPIHMMSAANFDKKDFLESGAIGFMSKPVTEESIASAFENIQININKELKKILLIEDQEFQSDLIKKAFAEQNINVIQAFTIESGMKKLEQEKNLDCIILDIKLPDGSGLEMLDRIKANPEFEKLPVIINTAYDLTTEQTERILRHTQSMVLKSSKSNNRLIDEVNLFLNKLATPAYSPIKNLDKIDPQENFGASVLENKTVLIADDDMRNVFALTSSLQQYNMKIEIANNGLEAVQLVENPEKKIDIVLMDIMMPEMDGYEAIQEIRKNKKHNNLPIIAVTAKAMKGDREKSIELGANDYVSKPIDLDRLVSLMQVWLS